jgi:hypothetical protein
MRVSDHLAIPLNPEILRWSLAFVTLADER